MVLPKLPPVILGSQSPRRQELLKQMGLTFRVIVRSSNEQLMSSDPEQAVQGIAAAKLATYDDLRAQHLIICADTIVALDGHILGKPANLIEAGSMLQRLSNRRHSVFTAVALGYAHTSKLFVERTDVVFGALDDAVIENYLQTAPPLDKAGGYGIQDQIGLLGIVRIEGDYYNVMGLPCARLWQELKAFSLD